MEEGEDYIFAYVEVGGGEVFLFLQNIHEYKNTKDDETWSI